MSAPVLSISEQKASISAKKKKKKTIKNVLNVPNNAKTECQVIQTSCVKTLVKILERLLPIANNKSQTPVVQCNNTSNEQTKKTEVKNKRNQLSLGVNVLSRNIKNDLISAVLLANDIQPKFLIHHLHLLCDHKKIPYLHMPGLRELTKKCLGFPCIAVGFKKNFSDFSEAVNEIKSISQTTKINTDEITESDEDETTDDEDKEKSDESWFNYLYRDSIKERIFVPDQSQDKTKGDVDFINLEKYDVEEKAESNKPDLPLRFKKQKKKLKNLQDFDDSQMDDDEDLEAPKKKLKKDWVIDKRGTKENVKYYTANLMRFPSNPDRTRRNK